MATVFVTGGTGLVGRAVLDLAARSGHTLRVLAREPGPPHPGVVWVRGALERPDTWRAALEGCEAVLHLAARTGAAPDAVYTQVNVAGTEALLGAASRVGVPRFVFVSTIAVRFAGLDRYPYARSKQIAEDRVRDSGLAWTVVRPTLVLGRGAPNLQKLAALAGLPVVPLLGGGRARLQPVDARDLAALLLDALESGPLGDVVEVGGPETLTMRALLTRIRRTTGRGGAPALPIPLGPVQAGVGLAARVLGARAPVTPAQLLSFVEDAVAEPHPWTEQRVGRLRPLDTTLTEALVA
ncbi:MAG: NAD(P)H-binding protein [Gemmatimonadetes bacterium]|nr:NAD(P)H-binding protein [Gemmatimonadota bacterium]